MRLVALTVLFLALGSSPALSASRSDALVILNNLMEEGAATRHPESFKVLIDTYFAGVKCLEEQKPELAAQYFALVEKYGKILAPYFLTLTPGRQLITPSRKPSTPVPLPSAHPAPGSPQAARAHGPEPAAQAGVPKGVEAGAGTAKAAPGAEAPKSSPAVAPPPLPVAAVAAPPRPQHPPAPPVVEQVQPPPATPVLGAQPRAEEPDDEEDEAVDQVATDSGDAEAAQPPPPLSGSVLGGETLYRVRANDTLLKIAARFKIRPKLLARLNRLTPASLLREGQTLRIVNRRIVPSALDEGLIINIADCTLYCFRDGKLVRSVPIAAGRAELKQNRSWQTPLGSFKVVDKVKNPSWRVPASIQKEMEQLGQEVKTLVPPGPENPLGKYALRTSLPGILIHGTNRPSSISSYSSHGCIRVSPANIELLYHEVPVNTAGKIVYRPVKVAVSEGKTYLEVHKDIYGKIEDLEREARTLIQEAAGEAAIDWRKVRRMVQEQTGVAEEVTRSR